jgi:hypothetical protein
MEEVLCLVNGDDILFTLASMAHLEDWKALLTVTGLTLSLGKNYVHPRFCTINSMLFDRRHLERDLSYLPLGLLLGEAKVMDQRPEFRLGLDDLYNKCLYGAKDRPFIHGRFLEYHRKDIKKLTFNGRLNLFGSPHMGGLGFEHYPEVKYSVTRFQLALATRLYSMIDTYVGNDLPALKWARRKEEVGFTQPSRQHGYRFHLSPLVGPLEARFRDFFSNSKPPVLAHPNIPETQTSGDKFISWLSEADPIYTPPREVFRDLGQIEWTLMDRNRFTERFRLVVEAPPTIRNVILTDGLDVWEDSLFGVLW